MAEEKQADGSEASDAKKSGRGARSSGLVAKKKVVKRKAVSKKTTQKKAVVKKAASKGQVTNVAPTPPVSGPGDASRDLPESPVSGKKRVTPRVAKVIDSNGVVTMSNEKHQESGEGGSVAGFWPKVIISLLIVIIVFLYLRARVHDGSEAVNESSPQHAQEAPAAPDLDTVKSTVTNQGSVTVAPPMEAGQPERAGVLPGSAPVTGGADPDGKPDSADKLDRAASTEAKTPAGELDSGPAAADQSIEALVIEAMKPESIEMVQKETEEPDTASSVAEGVDGESPATSDSAAPSSIGMETSGPGDDESRPGNGDTEPPPVASEPIAQSAEGVDTPSPTNHEAEPPVVEDSVTDSPGADEETAHATPDASARDFRELFGYRRPAPAFTVPEGVTPQDRRRFAPPGFQRPPTRLPAYPENRYFGRDVGLPGRQHEPQDGVSTYSRRPGWEGPQTVFPPYPGAVGPDRPQQSYPRQRLPRGWPYMAPPYGYR
ncbi:MAG: hypothetical protein KDI63_15805 [Gammaproteobacteria bacterium]|nr:hypothetical protein [Gammaproteobacteria bacterium]